ncbi:Flp pilus assembly protein CpaB [Desulforudis sp. 1088]|uniref:Flp pilus assembly protein CpaB n=1 Tax=unclassified Candidatus Desulforudis TaxID=2635950 RepID=UPI003CE4C493
MRTKLLFIFALVCGLAAAGGVYLYLNNLAETYRSQGNFAPVVVAKQTIPARTPIGRQSLEIKEIPADYVHPEAFTRIEDVEGRIARAEIYPGEQILASRFATPENSGNDLALVLQQGERAVSIAIDPVSGVSGMLQAGDKVDVAVTIDVSTSIVLQNIRVLAVNSGSAAENKSGPAANTCVLAVTPKQAEYLILATERGSIRLMLRSPADTAVTQTPAVRVEQLVNKGGS